MSLAGRASAPEDREQIAALMIRAMGIAASHPALCPGVQDWKYWQPHPLFHGARSQVLLDGEAVVAHGAIWPILLRGAFGQRPGFHLIDWAANHDVAGAGLRVLQQCGSGASAIFSIGGSVMTGKILPAFGFVKQNRIAFLSRPLRPWQPAWHDSPRSWKMPLFVLLNLLRFLSHSRVAVPGGWSLSPVEVEAIPEALFPVAGPDAAVSVRNAALLRHVMACPRILKWRAYTLRQGSTARAYFCLAQVGDRVRVADFGPAELDEATSAALASGVRVAAEADFPHCAELRAATTEPVLEAGFVGAGFHVQRVESINVQKLDAALKPVRRYRLTLLDWDALVA
jgi:hypothetical protein